jgi:hypothetical protein
MVIGEDNMPVRAGVVVLFLSFLSGCSGVLTQSSGVSDEGRQFIVEACADMYMKDWDQTSIESMNPYKNVFNEKRNRAAVFDEETRMVVSELANEASKLTELYNQWLRDMPTRVLENLDQVTVATDKFRDNQKIVAAEINRICEPFFQ